MLRGIYKGIKYNNTQWEKVDFPKYKAMLEIFRNNYWLAELSTAEYYFKFSRFIDIWDRWMAKTIPMDVITKFELLKNIYCLL